MITMEELKKKIGYLAHPYQINPDESFTNAISWTFKLRNLGFYVFSPILHTHPYWKRLKHNADPNYIANPDVIIYLDKEDWLDWDIRIIKGFMKNDGHTGALFLCPKKKPGYIFSDDTKAVFNCKKCNGLNQICIGNEQIGLWSSRKVHSYRQPYDSGIFMLMSNTAYENHNNFAAAIGREWLSKGCRTEYEFAKQNHIQIFELESFLNGELKEV